MKSGDFFIIGGKWVSSGARVQVHTFDHNGVDFSPHAEATKGDIGVVLSVMRDQHEHSSRWMNFYHVLFTNGITGLIHRCFVLKVE